jgi:CRP/FNR family transcriptional regulator, anaerobic regulatory protein
MDHPAHCQAAPIEAFEPDVAEAIGRLPRHKLPAGSVLFRPGDEAQGFVLVAGGAVSVFLTGRNGREIALYDVGPGQTCVQTTLCLLGGSHYSAEARATSDVEIIVVPRGVFTRWVDERPKFRGFVFRAFGARLAEVTAILEQVAFVKIEARLAAELLRRADAEGVVRLTHQELAVGIGSAREVISRRLESLARDGLVSLDRGTVRIVRRNDLLEIADLPEPG